MLKYWLNKLLGRPSVRFLPDRSVLEYKDSGRKIEIGGEILVDGFEIDVNSIVSWNDEPTKILNHSERVEIATGARNVVQSQWGWVVRLRNNRS